MQGSLELQPSDKHSSLTVSSFLSPLFLFFQSFLSCKEDNGNYCRFLLLIVWEKENDDNIDIVIFFFSCFVAKKRTVVALIIFLISFVAKKTMVVIVIIVFYLFIWFATKRMTASMSSSFLYLFGLLRRGQW